MENKSLIKLIVEVFEGWFIVVLFVFYDLGGKLVFFMERLCCKGYWISSLKRRLGFIYIVFAFVRLEVC